MRKHIAIAALCAAAFAAVPVASASASLAGACKFHGTATFPEPGSGVLTNVPEEHGYLFKSEAGGKLEVKGQGAECTGVNSETQKTETLEGSATVKGDGLLSCSVAAGVLTVTGKAEGSGTLTLAGKEFHFAFNFVAAAGNVTFGATGQLKATGAANFLLSKNESAEACVTKGVKQLEFESVASGVVG